MADKAMQNGEALPFSERQQQALLGHALQEKAFFLLLKDRVKPGWFSHPLDGMLWKILTSLYNDVGRMPSLPEIKDSHYLMGEDPQIRTTLAFRLDACLQMRPQFGLDGIAGRLQEWLQTHMYRAFMERSVSYFNSQNYTAAFNTVRDGLLEVQKVKFQEDEEHPFLKVRDHVAETKLELGNACTFGLRMMDALITPEAKNGSLLPGDTTVILAPTNAGKTTVMVTVAIANILAGKDVLFLTHEGRTADIEAKLWMNLLSYTRAAFLRMFSDPTMDEKINYLAGLLAKHMVWVPLLRPGLTIEEVDTIVRRKVEEKVIRTGRSFDLFIDDYPAKLLTTKAKEGQFTRRHIDDLVYNHFVNLALEMKWHSLVAIQANREGARVMKRNSRQDHTRLLTMEDVNESYGPMQTATNVITLNRDNEAVAKRVVTFYLAKSRGTETGLAFVCRSDFATATSHRERTPERPWGGGTYYRGADNMSDRADILLSKYEGLIVPPDALQDFDRPLKGEGT